MPGALPRRRGAPGGDLGCNLSWGQPRPSAKPPISKSPRRRPRPAPTHLSIVYIQPVLELPRGLGGLLAAISGPRYWQACMGWGVQKPLGFGFGPLGEGLGGGTRWLVGRARWHAMGCLVRPGEVRGDGERRSTAHSSRRDRDGCAHTPATRRLGHCPSSPLFQSAPLNAAPSSPRMPTTNSCPPNRTASRCTRT